MVGHNLLLLLSGLSLNNVSLFQNNQVCNFYPVLENASVYFICFYLSVPLRIVSLTLSPYNCLLKDAMNQLQCTVTGLPDPAVVFERSSDIVDCPVNGTCEISSEVEGIVTLANLTFIDVSLSDEGESVYLLQHLRNYQYAMLLFLLQVYICAMLIMMRSLQWKRFYQLTILPPTL